MLNCKLASTNQIQCNEERKTNTKILNIYGAVVFSGDQNEYSGNYLVNTATSPDTVYIRWYLNRNWHEDWLKAGVCIISVYNLNHLLLNLYWVSKN